jgi:tRNA (cmo5U34)-methyltransferase
VDVNARSPGAAWKQDDVATGFIDERRKLIPHWDAQEEITRRLITRGGRQVGRFLDLGAGDGGFAELVMQEHPDSTCVLVDFSEPMLAAVPQALAHREGRWETVDADLAEADWVAKLPRAERYDAVVSRLCIHHLPDERKRELYEEVFDLLEPGGLFMNWEHVAVGGLAEGMFDEYFIARMIEAEQERENPRSEEEVVAAYSDAHDDDILTAPEVQCRWLDEIGFQQTEVYFKALELAIFGGVKGEGTPRSRRRRRSGVS